MSPECSLITSDNPVVILDPSLVGKTPIRWVGLRGGIICLPITPRVILFCHNEPNVKMECVGNYMTNLLHSYLVPDLQVLSGGQVSHFANVVEKGSQICVVIGPQRAISGLKMIISRR